MCQADRQCANKQYKLQFRFCSGTEPPFWIFNSRLVTIFPLSNLDIWLETRKSDFRGHSNWHILLRTRKFRLRHYNLPICLGIRKSYIRGRSYWHLLLGSRKFRVPSRNESHLRTQLKVGGSFGACSVSSVWSPFCWFKAGRTDADQCSYTKTGFNESNP